MVLGVPSPPRPCNRSRVALLFTAYGEERNSLGKNGGLRLGRGLVLASLCGRGGLNLTPPTLARAVNSHRFDSEVKPPFVGICFCLLNNHGVTTSRSRNRQRKERKMGFGIWDYLLQILA